MMRAIAWAAAAVLGLSCSVAGADVVLRTGVNGSNAVLGAGTLDPFWTISTNGTSYTQARVLYPAQICCDMDTVANTAAWISDPSIVAESIETGWGIGNTVYARRAFDLTGFDLATTALSGVFRIADNTVGVFLNGNQIVGAISSTWDADRALNVAAGSPFFLAGLNTLELRGTSINSFWDGSYVNALVTARSAGVPEPATIGLLALALAGVAIGRRK